MKLKLTLLVLIISSVFGVVSQAQAVDYFISTTGDDSDNGLTEQSAWATFVYADTQLQPGDNLIILDGVYDQRIIPTHSGTQSGGYITYKAKNNFQVTLAPSVATNRATIDVISCPGCGGGGGIIQYRGI